jgi:hypothetical protein
MVVMAIAIAFRGFKLALYWWVIEVTASSDTLNYVDLYSFCDAVSFGRKSGI